LLDGDVTVKTGATGPARWSAIIDERMSRAPDAAAVVHQGYPRGALQ
jgi:hypothetical protein